MIRTPPRAVTRFLIPFIDVLILLFCIFLLMPFVSQPGEEGSENDAKPGEVEKLKLELALAERRIAELKKERANLFDRYHIKLLEIDRETGKLYAFDEASAGRQEIRSQADATRLIHRERSKAGAREACFLLLYPRELTGFPVREQVERYRHWFRDVRHAFDNPWSGS